MALAVFVGYKISMCLLSEMVLVVSQSQNSYKCIFRPPHPAAYLLPHLAANEYSDLSRSRARSSECWVGALASPRKDSTLLPILLRVGAAAAVVIGTLVVVLRGPLEVGRWVVVVVEVVVVGVVVVGAGVVVLVVVVVGLGVVVVVVVVVLVVGGGVVVSTLIGSKVVVSWRRCRVLVKTGKKVLAWNSGSSVG